MPQDIIFMKSATENTKHILIMQTPHAVLNYQLWLSIFVSLSFARKQ